MPWGKGCCIYVHIIHIYIHTYIYIYKIIYNINEGKKCGKNCTILTGNKQDALGHIDAFEAATKPTKSCNKPLLNQNVPQCVDILNK